MTLKPVKCLKCEKEFIYSAYRYLNLCSNNCFKTYKPKKMNNCKYCGKDCKLDYCSVQCADRRTKILLDIDNRKKQQRQNRRKFTTEELEKFDRIKEYLCN